MQVDIDTLVNLKIEGSMVELLMKIKHELYYKHLRSERGKSVFYILLQRALYGNIEAALLFWENLAETFQEWGFEINPYD
eukprot:6741259-Ditylum_brightwellii.AAC.1